MSASPPSAATGERGPEFAGEQLLRECGPSLWLIILHRLWWVWGAVVSVIAWVLRENGWISEGVARAGLCAAAISALVLAWNVLDCATRRYILTDQRIVRRSGVLRRAIVEVPLANVQSVTLLKSIRERVVGIGTIGITTAGSAGFEFTWFMVARPDEHLSDVRAAVAAAQPA